MVARPPTALFPLKLIAWNSAQLRFGDFHDELLEFVDVADRRQCDVIFG
jgi:hypothetical protein